MAMVHRVFLPNGTVRREACLLPGRFMVIEQAMGLPRNRSARAEALLRSFVEHAKASGEVAAALQRNHVQGVSVAPPARG